MSVPALPAGESGWLGKACNVDKLALKRVHFKDCTKLPAGFVAAVKSSTMDGPCAPYKLVAEKEAELMCPYVQGGNCTMASRAAVCARPKVRCPPMCVAALNWFCELDAPGVTA